MRRARPTARVSTRVPARVPAAEDDLAAARDLGIDTCGRIAEFWGFTRTAGRAFGLLYLSQDPLTQVELQDRLGISAGSASMTLTGLIRWGVVHKVWVRGQRKDHYRAETDFWKMIAGVLNERERREITAAVALVSAAEEKLRTAKKSLPAARRAEVEFATQRMARLSEICRLGEVMLDMLLGNLKLDVGKFRDVLKL